MSLHANCDHKELVKVKVLWIFVSNLRKLKKRAKWELIYSYKTSRDNMPGYKYTDIELDSNKIVTMQCDYNVISNSIEDED